MQAQLDKTNADLSSRRAGNGDACVFAKPVLKEPAVFREPTAQRTAGDFLSEMEKYLRLSGCAQSQYVALASTYLQGEAARYLDALQGSIDLSWPELKAKLIQAFDAVNEQDQAREEWHTMQMTEKEGIEAYYRKFMALLSKLDEAPSKADIIFQFRRGLTDRLRKATACDPSNNMQGYKDFDKLSNCAIAHGKALNGKNVAAAELPKRGAAEEGSGAEQALRMHAAKRKRVSELHLENQGSKAVSFTDDRICFKCKGHGHVSTDCPSKQVSHVDSSEGKKGKIKLHAIAAVHAKHSEECVCDDCDRNTISELRQMRKHECKMRKSIAQHKWLATPWNPGSTQ